MTPRKSLSEILSGNNKDTLEKTWMETETASEFAPLPRGEYEAVVIKAELFNARTGTPGVKLSLEVGKGEFKGRKFWHDLWLTPAAIPFTKRDLAKIGVTALGQLEMPLPARFVCKVKLAVRKNDEGVEFNHVSGFECIGVEKADPFAPVDPAPGDNE